VSVIPGYSLEVGQGEWLERFDACHVLTGGTLQRRIAEKRYWSHAVTGGTKPRYPKHSNRPCAAFESPASLPTCCSGCDRANFVWWQSFLGPREKKISGTLIGLRIGRGGCRRSSSSAITLVASGRLQGMYRLAFDTLSVEVQVKACRKIRSGPFAAFHGR